MASVEFSLIPFLAWLVSLLAVPAIILLGKKPDAREGITFLAAIVKFGLVLLMLPLVREGKILHFSFGEIIEGIPIEFRVDGLGILFAIVVRRVDNIDIVIAKTIKLFDNIGPYKSHPTCDYNTHFSMLLTLSTISLSS